MEYSGTKPSFWNSLSYLSQFLKERTSFLTGAFTDVALASETGVATFSVRVLRMLGVSSANRIALIANPQIARSVATHYDPNDLNQRNNMKLFNTLIGSQRDSIVSQVGEEAMASRKQVRRVLSDKHDSLLGGLEEKLGQWCLQARVSPVDLHASLYRIVTEEVVKKLFGIAHLPPDDPNASFSLDHMLMLIDRQDNAVMSMDINEIKKAQKELSVYSSWIYEHNADALQSEANLARHLVPGFNESMNVCALFLLTANISNFIALSVIDMVSDPKRQIRFRAALSEIELGTNSSAHIDRFYKEFARLYAGPSILSKYTGNGLSVMEGALEFEKATLFEIPVRRLRMSELFGEDFEAFNEDRYLLDYVPNPLTAPYSPFGFGLRRCPAADHFVNHFFLGALKSIFESHQWSLENVECMEKIPSTVHRIVLKERYIAKAEEVEHSAKLEKQKFKPL